MSTKHSLFLNILFATLMKIPYILIIITYTFVYSKKAEIIVLWVIDVLFFLAALPLFYTFYSRMFTLILIPLAIALIWLGVQIALVHEQFDNKQYWSDPDYEHFNWNWKTKLNYIFIVMGFFHPVIFIWSIFINLNTISLEQEEKDDFARRNGNSIEDDKSTSKDSTSETFDINNNEDSRADSQADPSVHSIVPIDEPARPNKSKDFRSNNFASINAVVEKVDDIGEDIVDSDDEKTVPLIRPMKTKRS